MVLYHALLNRAKFLLLVTKCQLRLLWASLFPHHMGSLASVDSGRESAVVLFSRFLYENKDWQNCGSGRMQLELVKALTQLNYNVTFVGQEDKRIPKSVFQKAEVIVGMTSNAHLIPASVKAAVWLLTTNSNIRERIARADRLRKLYRLRSKETLSIVQHEYGYRIADVLYVAENEFGMSMHAANGTPIQKVIRYNNRTSPEHFFRSSDVRVSPPGERRFFAWLTPCVRKGLPLLLETWLAWNDRKRATLTVIGHDGPEARLILDKYKERLADRTDIVVDLSFTAYADLPRRLECFDVSIFPTFEDAQPSQLLEAASMGYPIITTLESGVSFDKDFCSYFSPWDTQSLINSLDHWNLVDEHSILSATAKSRVFIQRHHNWEDFSHEFRRHFTAWRLSR